MENRIFLEGNKIDGKAAEPKQRLVLPLLAFEENQNDKDMDSIWKNQEKIILLGYLPSLTPSR